MSYFDAVINSRMLPLFNGTSEEVKTWLRENEEWIPDCVVVIGETLATVTASEYLRK